MKTVFSYLLAACILFPWCSVPLSAQPNKSGNPPALYYDEVNRHGFLGVSPDNDDEDEAGVQIQITPNSAAEKAGLHGGDKILAINGTALNDFEELRDLIAETAPGDQISITYKHNGQEKQTTATLGQAAGWDWQAWSSDDWNGLNLDFNVQTKEACLGVYTEASDLNNDLGGARITSFTSESAAKEAQLLENDVITAVNGQRIQNHSDLWTAIARYKAGDKIKVELQRHGKAQTIEATLKPCQDDASQVTVEDTDDEGDQQSRRFNTWNWNNDDQRQMRQNRLITIHKGGEGDAAKVDIPSAASLPAERKLQLESFKIVPNAADGQVVVSFRGAPVATIVSLLDRNGRQLFREELNMFGGAYNQSFDLAEYSKSTIVILVQQGDKSVTQEVVIK